MNPTSPQQNTCYSQQGNLVAQLQRNDKLWSLIFPDSSDGSWNDSEQKVRMVYCGHLWKVVKANRKFSKWCDPQICQDECEKFHLLVWCITAGWDWCQLTIHKNALEVPRSTCIHQLTVPQSMLRSSGWAANVNSQWNQEKVQHFTIWGPSLAWGMQGLQSTTHHEKNSLLFLNQVVHSHGEFTIQYISDL